MPETLKNDLPAPRAPTGERAFGVWRRVIALAVAALSVRQVVGTILSAYNPLVPLLFIASTVALSFFGTRIAIAALVACGALVSAMGGLDLLSALPDIQTGFAGLVIGWTLTGSSFKGREQPALLAGVLDAFCTIILISLLIEVPPGKWFAPELWHQGTLSYTTLLYPVTSAYGLLTFATLIREWDRAAEAPGDSTLSMERGVTACLTLSLIAFVALQMVLNLPEPYEFSPGLMAPTSPARDIHALGALAAWMLVSSVLQCFRSRTSLQRGAWGILSLLSAAISVWSWSRATWLALIVSALLLILLRLTRKKQLLLIGGVLAALVAINTLPRGALPGTGPYAKRFWALVYVRDLAAANPDRVNLYYKAWRMIRTAPVIGHGVGSFYRTSPRFARSGDPLAAIPNFGHNILLQTMAETGVASGLLLVAIFAIPLGLAYRNSKANLESRYRFTGLACLLTTQLTANALAIYPDQQLYFAWAVCLAMSCV